MPKDQRVKLSFRTESVHKKTIWFYWIVSARAAGTGLCIREKGVPKNNSSPMRLAAARDKLRPVRLNEERKRRLYASVAFPVKAIGTNRGPHREKAGNNRATRTKTRRIRLNRLDSERGSDAALVSCRMKLKRRWDVLPFSGILFRQAKDSFPHTGGLSVVFLCEAPFRGRDPLTKKLPKGSFLWCGWEDSNFHRG